MKKILMLLAAVLTLAQSFAETGRDVYLRYSDKESVAAVYISPVMFRLIGKLPDIEVSDDDINLSPILQSLKGFYLLSCEDEQTARQLKADVNRLMDKGKYEMLMSVKEDGEKVEIYIVSDGKEVSSLIMTVSEDDECVFMSIDGKMAQKDLEKLLASSRGE